MKTIKHISGLIIGFFSTTTIIEMFNNESGADLYGAITGYIIIMILSIWLVFSCSRECNNSNLKVKKDEKISLAEQNKQRLLTLSKENLRKLKESNILTQEEYDSKLSQITKKDFEEKVTKTNEYILLKNLYDSGLLDKIEFEEKTKILIERQSINKNKDQNKSEIVTQPLSSPKKENIKETKAITNSSSSNKSTWIWGILITIITLSLIRAFVNSNKEIEIDTTYTDTIAVNTPETIEIKKEEVWYDESFKNFSFKIPKNLNHVINLSNDNKQVYKNYDNNMGLTIDVGSLPEGYDENSTIKSLVNDVNTFGQSVNTQQRKNFNDFKLINSNYDMLGNMESIMVSQTSKNISENKNVQMMVISQFVVSYPYYFSFTFSYPENSSSGMNTITKVMNSFKFENNQKSQNIASDSNIEITNYTVNQNKAYFYSQPSLEFKRNAYLVFGEVISGSERKNGFVYVDYVNSNVIKTTGWLLISDLD